MEYPREFIEKVKAEYPYRKELHEKLERGDNRVGNYLAEKSELGMEAAEIIRAFEEGRQEDIKKLAEKCVRRKNLHTEWWNLNADWWKRKVAVNC